MCVHSSRSLSLWNPANSKTTSSSVRAFGLSVHPQIWQFQKGDYRFRSPLLLVCVLCLMRSLRLLQKPNYVILSGCFRCDFAEFARTVPVWWRPSGWLSITRSTLASSPSSKFAVGSTRPFVPFLSNRQQTKRIRIINFFYLSHSLAFRSLARSECVVFLDFSFKKIRSKFRFCRRLKKKLLFCLILMNSCLSASFFPFEIVLAHCSQASRVAHKRCICA